MGIKVSKTKKGKGRRAKKHEASALSTDSQNGNDICHGHSKIHSISSYSESAVGYDFFENTYPGDGDGDDIKVAQ